MGQDERTRAFVKALLDDVHALEQMLDAGAFEGGRRIGAEQEMFLVGPDGEPAPVALEVLATASDSRLTTELARFIRRKGYDPFEARSSQSSMASAVVDAGSAGS